MARTRISPIDQFDSEAPFGNEFRRLLAKVKKQMGSEAIKSIMFTSAMLSEGKSTTSSFLAVTAAKQGGMKTLLIDADLRRPSTHRIFNLERERGLSDILVKGFAPRETIKGTSIDKLDILTSGTMSENPSSVFDADAIGLMIEDLKFFYDIILIDAPPLMPVSDPMLLSSKVDRLLLVVKAGSTDRAVVRKAVDGLGDAAHKIMGVVLNNLNNSLPYYYDYNYYGYDYRPTKATAIPTSAGKNGSRRRREIGSRSEKITRHQKS